MKRKKCFSIFNGSNVAFNIINHGVKVFGERVKLIKKYLLFAKQNPVRKITAGNEFAGICQALNRHNHPFLQQKA